ncbi:hypothetical protein KUTeg_015518 [Tegillarca granosa]|uniref:Ig-like domain-containing protein n=1 Tax=Tegillarca granosa TaxID=220873 RepID=A0ABQ9EQC7_TEGGR|nr:hypothetical protein KUTeg_015518 [Tegillarca granosa]
MATGDLSWRGDGTKIQPGEQYWLNEEEKNKQGRNIVYTYGVLEYRWGVEVGTNKNPYICEISQQEVYRVVNEQRDFDYGTNIADPNRAPRGPKFIIQPRSIVAVGSVHNAEFECVAVGLPQPIYTILKIKSDGTSVALSSSIDPRYTITNGKLSIQNPNDINDTALYHCVVENQFGPLGEFPNTDRAPVNANAHEYAIINCLPPIHSPALSYQWYHADRGEFLMTSLMPHIFISRNGKLYFSEVAIEDAGNYRCIVKLTSNNGAAIGTNQPPSRTSRPIPLYIQNQSKLTALKNSIGTIWGPEISNDFPASFPTTPKRGENVYIECLAFGTVPITYFWTRKGLPLPTTASFSDHNRLLTIQNVQIEDSGVYVCHASRKNTANAVKEFTLTVECKSSYINPTFPLMDKHVDIGSQLTWRCEAKAIPSATYHWFVNGTLLQPNNVDMITNRNVLIIKNLDPIKHNGMYQCAASNTHGTTFTEGQLRVLAFPPTFMKSPLPTEVYGALNGNATIICNPEAAPTPEYKWLKNNADMGLSPTNTGSRIRMLGNGNLFFTSINYGDAAIYTCSVSNQYGSASSSTKLTVSSM